MIYVKLDIVNFIYLCIYFYFTEKEILLLHTKVDLIVTLGGDGTVLWVCTMFLLLEKLYMRQSFLSFFPSKEVHIEFTFH